MRVREKRQRWEKIRAYKEKHPELTQEEIGKRFKMCQVNVSKILRYIPDEVKEPTKQINKDGEANGN
jgi:hypothetical protein